MEEYRESKRDIPSDEDSLSSDSSAADDGVSWKRRKHGAASSRENYHGGGDGGSTEKCMNGQANRNREDTKGKSSRRQNNIWSTVVQGQEQRHMEFQIDNFDMNPSSSIADREVETYRYRSQDRERRHDRHGGRHHSEDRSRGRHRDHEHRDDRHHGKRKHSSRDRHRNDRSGQSSNVRERLGQRPNVRDRLGKREDPYSTPIRVTEDDDPGTVGEAIIERLEEKKGDLIRRIVEVVGNKMALQFMNETEDVERAGGMMTQDGKRRRQPGGVYLTLLKASKLVTEEQLKEINSFSKKMESGNKKRAEKRRKFLKAIRRNQESAQDHQEGIHGDEGESAVVDQKVTMEMNIDGESVDVDQKVTMETSVDDGESAVVDQKVTMETSVDDGESAVVDQKVTVAMNIHKGENAVVEEKAIMETNIQTESKDATEIL